MVKRVLIIGGYGNFGSYIARSLATDPQIKLLIGGRSDEKASRFARELSAANAAEPCVIDIDGDLDQVLAQQQPAIIIHTTGPFQTQDFRVAKAAIAHNAHYVDLADARTFVASIDSLDEAARAAGLLVVSGASSVPCLTAAIIDAYLPKFLKITSVDYGISAAQQTNRGLATTSAVLSYVGKPMTMLRDRQMQTVYGWADTHAEYYEGLGWRLFGNCDIPDLELFPKRYPTLRSMRFAAGHELGLLHVGTWALGKLVRLGLISSLDQHAELLLRMAKAFDWLGSGRSGFHMNLRGVGLDGHEASARFQIIARSGHGPYIPCMPAILLASRLAHDRIEKRGAMPCLDLVQLDDYIEALKGLDISVHRTCKNA
jgi:NAD(P)-dependent dehydrogenase (short-subunit alcohol dehydrogenase family)